MRNLSRRKLLQLAGVASVGSAIGTSLPAAPSQTSVSLFDGNTLAGWIPYENNATGITREGILSPADFAHKISTSADSVSVFLRSSLTENVRQEIAAFPPPNANSRNVVSDLVKDLNGLISGPSIYDSDRFKGVVLRPETEVALRSSSQDGRRARLNRLLLEDAYPADISKSVLSGWVVKDGAMASIGSGRGVLYTANDYQRFRLTFKMRHVSGDPDHQACVLIFCCRPEGDWTPLDALGGIQFQVPNGGHWDYRPGRNNNGGQEFRSARKPNFDPHDWSRVEIVADANKGVARMAVAQPADSKAVEVLSFSDPSAGRVGPIAWQMHNAGLFDEYKEVAIEPDPKTDDLITTLE